MLNRLFILTGALMLLMAGVLYLLLGKQASDVLVEQMLHREQLSARAGAHSLESFFNLFGRSLAIQAGRREIVSLDTSVNSVLEDFSTTWRGTPVSGAILLDINGLVKFNGNRLGAPDVGEDLSDRDYFTWAKTAKKEEAFVSAPVISRLGASKGKYIVGVATPVIDGGGIHKGTLAAAVILEELKSQYFEPMKVTEKSLIYLVNERGDVLSSDQEGVWGKNLFERIEARPFLGSKIIAEKLREALNSREEGKLDIAYPLDLTAYKPERMLVAYAPITIGENHLMLGIATPIEEAMLFITPFYFRNFFVVGLAFLGFLVIAIRIAKITSYKEAVEKEHKIHKIEG